MVSILEKSKFINIVVSVAIKKNKKYILVKELKKEIKGLWNFPSGKVIFGENLFIAAKREVKEETGFDFKPKNILGVYSLTKKEGAVIHHVIKIIFLGDITKKQEGRWVDEISEIKWFTPEEIEKMDMATLRDVDIKIMVKDYFAGKKYPLDLITHTIQK